ncbi:glycosyltransferase BC10-like [Salvia hispanica]|uniref:glycosyltransferase BC10-like n=1 Tax=Salvia hispanica TaxID=49212 RepID=UPI002009AEC7|nr:glycosyltransferase BC10-like [Salvia hispanica]
MQSRVSTLEEGQVPPRIIIHQHNKHLPLRLLLLFLLLGVGLVFLYVSMYTYGCIRIHDFSSSRIHTHQACVQRLASWTRPPLTLVHEMNDTELFSCASSSLNKLPSNRTPKIAFMFLTRGPLPLSPLWDKFFQGNDRLYSIYIHSSPTYDPDFDPSSPFYGRQIPSQVAEWGRMSMCDAERRLLANALLDVSNEWFVLVSEACIPLKNFSTIYTHISQSHLSFLGAFDEDSPNARGRYNWGMEPEVNLLDWRKGSQWFELSRKLAVDVVRDTFYYPKFKYFCRADSCYSDEHYLPTMLTLLSPRLLANRTLTWVDWSRGGPHPALYDVGELTENFFKDVVDGESCMYNNHTTNLCFMFLRKIAPSALDHLMSNSLEFFGY